MYFLTIRPSKKNKKDMVIIKESEDLQELKLLGALAKPSAIVEIYADRKKGAIWNRETGDVPRVQKG